MYSSYEALTGKLVGEPENPTFTKTVVRHLPDGTCRIVATFFGKHRYRVMEQANAYAAEMEDAATREGF